MAPRWGTRDTRTFYDLEGWIENEGRSVDAHLFWAREDGPIRSGLHALHWDRIHAHLGGDLNLLEVGCGGNPEPLLWPICKSYVGCDFSSTGLALARKKVAGGTIPCEFFNADACSLPFADGGFDAVYSAHMIYHIANPEAQAAAIGEMVRVVRPGGHIVLIAANPRPLAFPSRTLKRLLADSPARPILDRLRKPPTLPYNPRPIGQMVEFFRKAGASDVQVFVYAIPSTEFAQKVSEFRGYGKPLWRLISYMDRNFPRLSGRLGCYVTFAVTR